MPARVLPESCREQMVREYGYPTFVRCGPSVRFVVRATPDQAEGRTERGDEQTGSFFLRPISEHRRIRAPFSAEPCRIPIALNERECFMKDSNVDADAPARPVSIAATVSRVWQIRRIFAGAIACKSCASQSMRGSLFRFGVLSANAPSAAQIRRRPRGYSGIARARFRDGRAEPSDRPSARSSALNAASIVIRFTEERRQIIKAIRIE